MSRGGGVEAWEGMFRGVYLDIFIFPWPFFLSLEILGAFLSKVANCKK